MRVKDSGYAARESRLDLPAIVLVGEGVLPEQPLTLTLNYKMK